jgi:hypothetical protein
VWFADPVSLRQIPANLDVVGDEPTIFSLRNRHVRRNRARGISKDKLWTALMFFSKLRNEGRARSLEINILNLELIPKGWIVG